MQLGCLEGFIEGSDGYQLEQGIQVRNQGKLPRRDGI